MEPATKTAASTRHSAKPQNYRPDVDGLRAVAVLSVVLYHAFPKVFCGGFIGVDIFFVISGFLISGILCRNLLSEETPGSVRLLNFYERRIRRIFPVLIVVLLSVLAAGFLLFTPIELKTLGKHVLGGAGYVSNFVLWREAGYFDQTASLKPLLHLWSLGVEEQFYIVWPLLLWLFYKIRLSFSLLTAGFTAASFILCLQVVSQNPTAAFYAPWTRVWELSAGGVLAWIVMSCKMREGRPARLNAVLSRIAFCSRAAGPRALRSALSILGVLCLAAGFCTIRHTELFPGWNALLPVLGAVCIIGAGADAWFNRVVLSNRLAVFIGLISYPLYLWHWPLLSFEYILCGGTPPSIARVLAMAAAILLAWLTYRFVEPPLRYGSHGRLKAVLLFLCVAAIGVGGYGVYKNNGFPGRVGEAQAFQEAQAEQDNYDAFCREAGRRCAAVFPEWSSLGTECLMQKPAGENTVAVIGDSHAAHLFAGLAAAKSRYSFELFPGSGGVPFLDVSSNTHFQGEDGRMRADVYLRHRDAYRHIAEDRNIRVVLLAHRPDCSYQDAIDRRNPGEKDFRKVLHDGLVRTLDMLQKADKQVIIVLDNPQLPFEPGHCGRRPLWESSDAQCRFPRKLWEDRASRRAYEGIVREAAPKYGNVRIVDLADRFCGKELCTAVQGGKVLYRDFDHLNMAGSKWAASFLLKAIDEVYPKEAHQED